MSSIQRYRAATPLVGWLGLLALAGCGYRLSGASSVLPPQIKVLVVTPFDNRTTRPEIEQRVTEAVARELSRRGGYKVITDRSAADAVLEGAVTSYRTAPVQFGDDLLATRMEAVVTLQASVRELSSDAILWSQAGLVFRGQFDVPAGQDFFDRETIALDDIARGAADALVHSILEGF